MMEGSGFVTAALFINLGLIGPLLEELLFRSLLQNALLRSLPKASAVSTSCKDLRLLAAP